MPSSRSSRRIAVTACCQTGGLAATLKAIFPRDDVRALELWNAPDPEASRKAEATLKECDAWVSTAYWHVADALENKLQIVKVPLLRFTAFHPDLCYAKKSSTGEWTSRHYNSTIAVWAYRNRIETKRASRLFNASTFAALGYFDVWADSVEHLRSLFISCGMGEDFQQFLMRMQRSGVFMHSVNHPKVTAVVSLGKIVATRLGADSRVWDKPIEIIDGLSGEIWPIYPEIAMGLALPGGSYTWKLGHNLYVEGTDEYLQFSYSRYRAQGIAPHDLSLVEGDESRLDDILGLELEKVE